MRRLLGLLGVILALGTTALFAVQLTAVVARDAREAELTGHQQRLEDLAAEEDALEDRIKEIRGQLQGQRKDNGATRKRIEEQERRISEVEDRIEELGG